MPLNWAKDCEDSVLGEHDSLKRRIKELEEEIKRLKKENKELKDMMK